MENTRSRSRTVTKLDIVNKEFPAHLFLDLPKTCDGAFCLVFLLFVVDGVFLFVFCLFACFFCCCCCYCCCFVSLDLLCALSFEVSLLLSRGIVMRQAEVKSALKQCHPFLSLCFFVFLLIVCLFVVFWCKCVCVCVCV